jgi:hypothetical protein
MSDDTKGESKRTKKKNVLFHFLYDADKILRKRLFVAQPMALARRAELPDEIYDLDDVVHDLFPHLAIQIDFLCKPKKKKPQLSKKCKEKGKKNNTARTPLILIICTKIPATAPM